MAGGKSGGRRRYWRRRPTTPADRCSSLLGAADLIQRPSHRVVSMKTRGIDTRTLQAFMGHRSIANTVVYTAVADKRIRNIWGKR
jgi:integrase